MAHGSADGGLVEEGCVVLDIAVEIVRTFFHVENPVKLGGAFIYLQRRDSHIGGFESGSGHVSQHEHDTQ